jgi:hypothetical protein
VARKQRETRRGEGKEVPFKSTTPRDLLPPTRPTGWFLSPPIILSDYESINGLTHLLSQNLYGLSPHNDWIHQLKTKPSTLEILWRYFTSKP